MAQTQMSAKDLTGFNIYQTKNQTIYWDQLSKTAFIISKSDVSSYSTWQLRFPLSMMVSLIMMLLGLNYSLCVIIGLVIYAISTVVFRVKYLPTLAISVKWTKPKSEGFIKDTAKKFRFGSLIFVAITFLVFSIMFGVDLYLYRSISQAFTVYALLVILSAIGTVITFIIAFQRRKLDKQKL